MVSCGDGGYVAKIGDFGTCIQLIEGQKVQEAIGTSGYTAPEVLENNFYDFSADIFSFGVVQWEALYISTLTCKKKVNPLCGKDIDETIALVKIVYFINNP